MEEIMLFFSCRTLFILTIIFTAFAANAGAATFTAAASGDWTAPGTWSVSGADADGIPDADDTVSIPNTRMVTVTGAQTVQNISVATGGTLTVNGGATLTLAGVPSSSFNNTGTVGGSGSVIIQGTGSFNLNSSFTVLLVIEGAISGVGVVGGPVTVMSGGTLNTTNQSPTILGDLSINFGGTMTKSSGTVTVSGANIINNGTITGNTNFNGGAQSYSGSGVFTATFAILSGTTVSLAGNTTLGNGTTATGLTLNTGSTLSTNSFTMNLNRVSMSGAGAVNGAGPIRFDGASSLAGSANHTAPIIIAGGTTSSSGGTIGGNLTVQSGAVFNSTNQSVTIGGALTVDAGGTMTKTSGTVTLGGPSAEINGTVTGGGFNFGGSGTQNFSGSGTIIAAVSVGSGSVTTLVSDATIGDGVNAASLALNTGGTLAVGNFTLTLNRVGLSGAGTATSTGAGKVRMQAASSLSIASTFTAALEINSGTTNTIGGTIGGPLTILGGATMNITNQTVALIGDVNIGAGGSLVSSTLNGTINAASSNILNNGTVSGLAFRFSGTTQSLSGTGNIAGPVTIFSGSTVTLVSDHQFATIVVNTGGTLATGAFTAFLTGGGTPLSGAGTIANVNVTYNGTAAQTVQATNVTYNRLGIDNPANVTLSAAESVASRLILANGTFNNGANLSLASNATIARANGSLQASPTFLGVINIEYYGSSPIATGLEIPPTNTIGDLTDNNTNTVTLSNSLTVNGNSVLASGSTLTGVGGTALNFNGASFSNNGTESVPTTTFSGAAQSISGSGSWTGGIFQLAGASATSMANSMTFSTSTFSVPSGTSISMGGSTLTFNGAAFTNAGTVTGAVRTTGANVALTAGASGFNASLNVNAGLTAASGLVNGALTVDGTSNGLQANTTLTVVGNAVVNAPLSGASTFRFNGSTFANNAPVSVAAFQFGGAAQSLTGSGAFTGASTILSGSNTTLGADKQMGSVAVNAGATFNIANRTLLLSAPGAPLTNAGTFTSTGSTVEYNGTSPQTLSTGITSYNNLSLNNPAGVTGFAGLTVNNLLRVRSGTFTTSNSFKDVQIDSAGTLAGVNGTTISMSGNWVNDGTFTANGNTVNFNGGAGQSIGGGSATTFNNLIAATASPGLVLGQNATVGGQLTLTNDVTTGAFTLTMPSTGTSTGNADVLGSVKRTGFTGGGSALSFGNPFNSIAFASGGTIPADVTVNLVKTIPVGFPAAIQRTYTITPSGGSGYTSTVRLHYLDAELNGNSEANLKLWRFAGFWALQGSTSINSTSNWVEQTGVTQFSPWTISSGEPPKITGRVTYENTSVPNVPVAGTTMTASGSPNSFGTTDLNGNYTITGLGLGSYTVTPSRPDMNSTASNGIFSNDAALIARHIVGLTTLNAAQVKAASVSGQPTLTSLDAGFIARWIVGISSPANQTGKWKFTPSERIFNSVLTDQANQNHTAILLGDVSGDWAPGLPRARAQERPVGDPVIISAGRTRAVTGDQVNIPIRLDGLETTPVSSYQFDLEFDPDVVAPVENSASVAGTLSEGLTVVSNVAEPGLLKVVVFGAMPVNGDGVHADLRFNVVGGPASSSALSIKGFRFNDGIDSVAAVDGTITVGSSDDESDLAGRLLTPTGGPVAAAEITVTDTAGDVRLTRSDHFGRFQIDGLKVGETYTVSVTSKRFTFDPLTVSIIERVTTLELIARPGDRPSEDATD